MSDVNEKATLISESSVNEAERNQEILEKYSQEENVRKGTG